MRFLLEEIFLIKKKLYFSENYCFNYYIFMFHKFCLTKFKIFKHFLNLIFEKKSH